MGADMRKIIFLFLAGLVFFLLSAAENKVLNEKFRIKNKAKLISTNLVDLILSSFLLLEVFSLQRLKFGGLSKRVHIDSLATSLPREYLGLICCDNFAAVSENIWTWRKSYDIFR